MTDALTRAHDCWAEGRRLNDLGRFADARVSLGQARDLLAGLNSADAVRIGIRVDITAALTHLELEGYAAAAELLTGAAERARSLRADDLIALAGIQHGVIDARCGQWDQAARQLRQVVPLFAHIGPVEQCSTLITLGLAELSLRQMAAAEETLTSARALAREHDLPVHLFKATHNLGCAAYVGGDLPRALRLMGEADAMPVDVARERARLDLATALLEAGLLDRAREALTGALDAARRAGQRFDEGDILLDLARWAVLDGDRDLARRLAADAQATFTTRQAQPRRRAAELFIAGLDAADGVRLAEAVRVGEQWRTADSLESTDAALVRAEAHLGGHDLDACAADLDAIAATDQLLLSRRLHELHLRARLTERRNRPAEFTAAAQAASELVASAQGAIRSLEVRAALAEHAGPLARRDLARALERGEAADVFATIERWRAASRRALVPVAAHDPTTDDLVAELRWLRAGLAPDPTDQPARQERITDLERAIAAAQWQQSATAPAHPDRIVDLDRLRDRLAPGTVYVAFTETADTSYALLVCAESERLVPIAPTAEVSAAVARLRRDLRGAAHAAANPRLRDVLAEAVTGSARMLDTVLLAPLRPWLTDHDRLVLAPSALLHAVPWAALPGIEHRPVTVASSATSWARAGADRTPVTEVGIVTGPAVGNAGVEADQVGSIWSAVGRPVRTGPGPATAAEAVAVLAGTDLVHVAAHGEHAEHNPLFSSLSMADGPLFAHELSAIRARHVVLSACDVGRSRVRTGDETLGLTAALLTLGVQNVIAAVTPVPHEVAAQASRAYHAALADGLDAAAALARATRDTPGAEVWCSFGGEFAPSAEG